MRRNIFAGGLGLSLGFVLLLSAAPEAASQSFGQKQGSFGILGSSLPGSQFSLLSAFQQGPPADPFEGVTIRKLPNGLTLVMAPSLSSDMVEIRVEVGAGMREDPWGKAGTAHLLEHYLFWDYSLPLGVTYMDLLKEKGAKGNGVTSYKNTTYFATIEKTHAEWAVDIFSRILFDKSFLDQAVDHARKPVYLEIGEPTPFDYLAPQRIPLYQKLTHVPGFWEQELGISEEHGLVLRSSDRIDTKSIQAEDLEAFYKAHYRPDNIVVFVAGGIDQETMEPLLVDLYGSEPARPAPAGQKPQIKAKVRPYREVNTTSLVTPRIEIGAKAINANAEDQMIADIYLRHLSHRLMKDLRNLKGETYSVGPSSHFHDRHGIFAISFETPAEHYEKNVKHVRELIQKETQEAALTEAQFKEAIQHYRSNFRRDSDARSLLGLATGLYHFRKEFPEQEQATPYSLYSSITYDTYKARLKELFRPELSYEDRLEPPVFFRFDSVVFAILGFCFWMFVSKKLFARNFPHDKIQWVRKLRYFPAYMVHLSALGFSLFFSLVAISALFRLWAGSGLNQQPALLSEYLPIQLSIGLAILGFQICMMSFARKVMVADGKLWVKSIGYWSHVYPLAEVKSVRLMHPLRLLFSPVTLYRTSYRFFYYFDLRFWQKGLLIELKNKKCLFVALTDPKQALQELQAQLPAEPVALPQTGEVSETSQAA